MARRGPLRASRFGSPRNAPFAADSAACAHFPSRRRAVRAKGKAKANYTARRFRLAPPSSSSPAPSSARLAGSGVAVIVPDVVGPVPEP